jgi:hypothetical protein
MSAHKSMQEATKPQGYINLHRKIREHWLWEDPVKFQWWVDILMECNYTERKVNIGGTLLECKRGESLNSLKTWAKRWRVDMGKVRRFFKFLDNEHMIETVSEVKTTRLRVCNYDTYNNPQHANDTQTTRGRHSGDTQTHTNNKDKKDNKGKKGDAPPLPVYGSAPEPRVPTLEDVRIAFNKQGGTEEMAEKFYSNYESTGWRKNNSPIRNFVPLVSTFITNYKKIEAGQGGKSATFALNKDDKHSYI